MDEFSLRPTSLARSFSSGEVVRPEETNRPMRLSRSSFDLAKSFLDKEEYLAKKKVAFPEEFKSARRYDDDDPYRGCFDDYDYDEPFTNPCYEGYYGEDDSGEDDQDDLNTNSNSSAPTGKGTGSSGHLHVPRSSDLETMLQDQSSTPHHIPLRDLKQITDNFSEGRILGHGGFGVVYKGFLRNGKMVVVKKIVSSLIPGLHKQFESEVCHLMMVKHPNIVRCIGYCYETRNECLEYNGQYVFAEMAERLLCLEYLPKGSLDKYISDESSGLDWSTRYKIIKGICYGLCHLHDEIDKPIIHLDLKPANILLDDGLVPKIADFGLSRLFGRKQTICTASCVGTFGYMAPEFLHGGIITPKLDIFSLGVMIMEIITGHRNYPQISGTSSNDFIELALDKWSNVLQRSTRYGFLEMYRYQIKGCIHVGLICVNPDRNKRPPIAKIINMLEGLESIDCTSSNKVA